MRLARLLAPLKKTRVKVYKAPSIPSGPAGKSPAPRQPVSLPMEYLPPLQIAEKRRFPRYVKDFKIDLLDGADRPAEQAVQLVDMSPRGIGIECSQVLAVGQTLGFRLSVQGRGIVEARAKVRWARPNGFRRAYGLEIEGIGFLTRQALARCLDPDAKALGLPEILTLVLQASSTLMALYVVSDWLRSNPDHITALLMFAPYLLLVGVVAFVAWAMPRS